MLAQEDQHHHMALIKGKRTKRPRPAISGDDSCHVATSSSTTTTTAYTYTTEEEEDMAQCLILLAQGATKAPKMDSSVYECKTCSRCFPSFQALGGHRASHKRPRSPAEAALPVSENHDSSQSSETVKTEELGLSLQMACNSSNTLSASNNAPTAADVIANKPSKVHACAICGAEFSSGQALGGHMRRHRPINASGGGSPAAKPVIEPPPARNLLCLDLNLPADEQDDQQQPESSKFMFTSEKTLVFAASLVDCRY